MGKCIIMCGGSGGIDPDELTVQPGEVLSGKLAGVQGRDEPVAGTMPNRGAWTGSVGMNGTLNIPSGYHNGSGKVSGPSVTQRGAVSQTLNAGGSYTIPEGYHNGNGKVTANSLASQTSATATAAQILSGKTAWVNGSKLTGIIANMAGQTITPSSSQQTISCSGKYMTGNVIVSGVKIYKQINAVVKSSTTMTAFTNWDGSSVRMYTVTYGALGFTPQMVMVVNVNSSGDAAILATTNGGQIGVFWWDHGLEDHFGYAVNLSENAGKCYYGSSGIKFPVGNYNTDYRIMAFGY
ncbi:hypothetical protein [Dysgonomonas gadei]|uniref:hypothetical protein n=1 Tax=Dysgonomonas gadei TaxID=156974 RepID=UPI003AEF5C67